MRGARAPNFSRSLASMLFVWIGLCAFCHAQSQRFDRVFDLILATHRFSEVSISPDAKHVVWIESTVKNDTENEHVLYVTSLTPNQVPKRVDLGDPRAQFGVSTITWSPTSGEFAYVTELTRDGQSELRIAAADGTRSRQLAILKGAAFSPRWSPDGRNIALLGSELISTEDETPRLTVLGKRYQTQQLLLIDVKSGSLHSLSPPDLFVYEYDWSPDNHQIVATAAPCCTEREGQGEDNWWTSELYILDVNSRQAHSIHKPTLQIAAPKWSPDGNSIAFIGGLMSDFIAPGGDLFLIPVSGGIARNVTPNLKASITWFRWTKGDEVLATEIADGEGAIATLNLEDSRQEEIWRGAQGPFNGGLVFALSLASDGRTSATVRESFNDPPEVWAGPIGQWRQLSSLNRDRGSATSRIESLHWTSDGMQVQGWLVYPSDYAPERKYPMVVSVHGGPAAAALSHWPAAFDNIGILSKFGYFIFYPNPRGSFGQGEHFTQGNVRDLGHGDLRDIATGVNHVVQNAPVDQNRIGITGWSYGGFMAMWAITQTDIFHASVAGPGVSDWQSYYGQTEIEKWLIPYFGASVYDDPEAYEKSSPILFVKKARAPTLFYVGSQDSICPAPQSFQLWRALIHLDVETELIVYSNEGHGITQPADQRDVTRRTLAWFDNHLKSQAANH